MEGEETSLEYLDDLERQNKELRNKNTEYQSVISNTSFNNTDERNLIQWQLETDDILDKIEHFLKGDVIETDEEGNTSFVKQKDESLVILNEYGVNSIMQILGIYVNRNHILSFYDEERINEILGDLGDEIAIFVYCNYEKMGMTTEFKRSRYKLLVINVLHIIESAYRRALKGKEREEINTGRTVMQSENIGSNNRMPVSNKPRFNPLKPNTYY